jgi:hypothetical protein
MRRPRTLAVCVAALAVPAAPAHGDGLPILGIDVGATGVTVPGGDARYVTLPMRHSTLLVRIRRDGGRVLTTRRLSGDRTIPAVAYDGSPGGLSADGGTLVLIRPRRAFPQRRTTLVVLGTPGLHLRRAIRLRGDFSFDAVAPDGRAAYLLHYATGDPTRYEVRRLDLGTGRLTRAPVVDPREPDEAMGGLPVTRAASPDGRWAYTLYDRPGGEPFVHALDTVAGSARCIDLPALEGRADLPALELRTAFGGAVLAVRSGSGTVLEIDTATWQPRRYAAIFSMPGADAWPVTRSSTASSISRRWWMGRGLWSEDSATV